MARPTKHNVTYLPHDCDMRHDAKIRNIRRNFGHEGYSLWNMLLEFLGDCDYFEYQWTDENIELLEADFDMDIDRIKEIVDRMLHLNLLQIQNGYLTCDKLTDRLESEVLSRRKDYDRNNSLRNGLMTTLTNLNNDNDDNNRQSKVKESKVKEIKEKENKVKEIKEIKEKQIKPLTDYTKSNGVMGEKSFMEMFYENPNTSVTDYLSN